MNEVAVRVSEVGRFVISDFMYTAGVILYARIWQHNGNKRCCLIKKDTVDL